MRIRYDFSFLLLSLVVGLAGCSGDEDRNIPNVSDINVSLDISRFEQAVPRYYGKSPTTAYQSLSTEFPSFFEPVFVDLMLPALKDTVAFNNFLKAPIIQDLFDTCGQVYQNFSPYETELTTAFKFYKHYFPNRKIPKLVTYASEYNYGNFTLGEDLLGIGLDFFLGPEHPGYPREVLPKYVRRAMTAEHLVSKTMQAMVTELVPPAKGGRMLDEMIRNGKVLYILDHLLPIAPDSIKLAHTAVQTDWLNNNELAMWTFFLGEELLYSTQYKSFRKYVDVSPDAPGMPADAPGRAANWLGWQIVKQYMKKEGQNMEDLILQEDAQVILNQSKYKPKR